MIIGQVLERHLLSVLKFVVNKGMLVHILHPLYNHCAVQVRSYVGSIHVMGRPRTLRLAITCKWAYGCWGC